MAKQWIDATTLRQLVMAPPVGASGVQALLERAHNGLVKIKARLLVIGGRRASPFPPRSGRLARAQSWSRIGEQATFPVASMAWATNAGRS